jgi:hypothetical protein
MTDGCGFHITLVHERLNPGILPNDMRYWRLLRNEVSRNDPYMDSPQRYSGMTDECGLPIIIVLETYPINSFGYRLTQGIFANDRA